MRLILDVIISGFIQGAIYGLIAAGLNLQYGVARILNVAHGEFVMIGAFWTYCLHTFFGIDPLLSLVIFSPITLMIGYFLYRSLFQYIRKSSETAEMFEGNSMLVSFGLLYVIQNLALLWWGTSTKAYSYFSSPLNFLGVTFEANRVLALFIGAAVMAGFYLFLRNTRLGKAIRAAAESPTSAQLSGIDIHKVLGLCFGLGATLACVAGGLISMMNEITASMGFPYLICFDRGCLGVWGIFWGASGGLSPRTRYDRGHVLGAGTPSSLLSDFYLVLIRPQAFWGGILIFDCDYKKVAPVGLIWCRLALPYSPPWSRP
jgi:branched-chain amino acid transport system permease protein